MKVHPDDIARAFIARANEGNWTREVAEKALSSELRRAYEEGREDALDEMGVLRGEDAARVLQEIKNVCSPEETKRRIEFARRQLEGMGVLSNGELKEKA